VRVWAANRTVFSIDDKKLFSGENAFGRLGVKRAIMQGQPSRFRAKTSQEMECSQIYDKKRYKAKIKTGCDTSRSKQGCLRGKTRGKRGKAYHKACLHKFACRYYRVKNEKTRFITGTGMGIPIVNASSASWAAGSRSRLYSGLRIDVYSAATGLSRMNDGYMNPLIHGFPTIIENTRFYLSNGRPSPPARKK
jgi:hypothetical protein